MKYLIEIATSDYTTTASAVTGGADRIELCAALSEGGISPSFGTIKKCREDFSVSLFPIIRPGGGDFLFNEEELSMMHHGISLCKELGCDGVVIGALKKDGGINLAATAKMVHLAYPMEVTFHRAFDRCKDPFEALEQLVSIGCTRILTSGQQLTAPQGVDLIAKLVEQANERIIIMPGSGVRKENIKSIAEKTGAVEFHSSLRGKTPSKMNFLHPNFASGEDSSYNPFIDPAEVKALADALNN